MGKLTLCPWGHCSGAVGLQLTAYNNFHSHHQINQLTVSAYKVEIQVYRHNYWEDGKRL